MSAVRTATSRLRRVCPPALRLLPGLALSLCLALADHALAQDETSPAQQPIAPLAEPATPPAGQPAAPGQTAQPSAPPAFAPGLVDKLGDLIKGSVDSLSSNLKGTQQGIQDLNKGTVDTLSRLPVTGFATGHALCPRSNNGAPDCRIASDQLCQAKGFKNGRGLDVESAENCDPRVFLPGHQRKPEDCRTDNYVTRAACN